MQNVLCTHANAVWAHLILLQHPHAQTLTLKHAIYIHTHTSTYTYAYAGAYTHHACASVACASVDQRTHTDTRCGNYGPSGRRLQSIALKDQ